MAGYTEAIKRIESLKGKVLAAQAAIRALIACHPGPEKTIETVCEHLDRYTGLALAGNHPDEFANALATAEQVMLPSDDEIRKARS